MWPETLTACECTSAGWCARHKCLKVPVWHLLCRRDEASFQLWEAGQGPCLPIKSEAVSAASEADAGPGFLRRAVNLGRAVVQHAGNGFVNVDDAVYEARLSVCRVCDSCDTAQMICRRPECGCYLHVKARWRTQQCPLGKWPEPTPTTEEAAVADDSPIPLA